MYLSDILFEVTYVALLVVVSFLYLEVENNPKTTGWLTFSMSVVYLYLNAITPFSYKSILVLLGEIIVVGGFIFYETRILKNFSTIRYLKMILVLTFLCILILININKINLSAGMT